MIEFLETAWKKGNEILVIGEYIKIYNNKNVLESSFLMNEDDKDYVYNLDLKEVGGFTFVKGINDYE